MDIAGDPVSGRTIFEVHGIQATFSRLIMAITNGSAAVDVFFVLSGFVLAKSLEGQEISITGWVRFVVRRLFRILPALLASFVFIGALLEVRSAFRLFSSGHDWYEQWHFTTLKWNWLVQNALLMTSSLNPPSWTLRVEVLSAFVFPVAILIVRRLGLAANSLLWVALAFACDHFFPPHGERAWFYFGFLFLIGVNCASYGKALIDRIPERSSPWVVACSLALVMAPGFMTLQHRIAGDISIGLGASGLIAILASDRSCRGLGWLGSRTARFLGKISFSFYLLHYAILYAVSLWLTDWMGAYITARFPSLVFTASALISIVICIPLAWGMYKWIERPFTSFGRNLANRIAAKREAQYEAAG